jgi:hypothetical protein
MKDKQDQLSELGGTHPSEASVPFLKQLIFMAIINRWGSSMLSRSDAPSRT